MHIPGCTLYCIWTTFAVTINLYTFVIVILEDSWIKLVTSVYFYLYPKFFKSKTVACVYDGVISLPTANPLANMLKWFGCGDKITDLKEWPLEKLRRIMRQK